MSRGRRGGERSTTGLSLGPDSALQSCFLHPSGTGDEGGIFCAGGRSEGGPWDQSEEGSVPGRVVQGQQSQVLQAGLSPEGRRSRPAPVPLVRWVVVPAPPGAGRGPPFQEKNVLQRRRVPMVSPRWRGGQGQLGTGASCGVSGCQLGAGSALRTCGNQDREGRGGDFHQISYPNHLPLRVSPRVSSCPVGEAVSSSPRSPRDPFPTPGPSTQRVPGTQRVPSTQRGPCAPLPGTYRAGSGAGSVQSPPRAGKPRQQQRPSAGRRAPGCPRTAGSKTSGVGGKAEKGKGERCLPQPGCST